MLAYVHFAQKEMSANDDDDEMTYETIEKFVQTCKTHRNTADQESGHIAKLWKLAMFSSNSS